MTTMGTTTTTNKVKLPELSLLQRGRLWFRYQRYAFALIGLPVAVITLSTRALPWWAVALVSLVALAPVRFGIEVWSRYPRKIRATRIALARIESGTFSPASIKRHCGDPCFRLVADEILARANMPRAERKLVIKRFAEQLRKEDSMLVLVDHVRGTVLTLGGDTQER
jgi:hypothetical protein